MGETSEEAAKELLAEGYTILSDDKGGYADLNKDAGSKSILKGGPNQKIVYLGYKTTASTDDAITDLAVMNMNGGYSFQDYEKLMDKQMDTQIKPFVNRFIDTLSEYRENLQKPQDSVNYKRANYYKMLLNKLTDDDTGGQPIGDLLVNQTKYEMGDDAYNALSDAEKKQHCDILTLLMQGNGQAVQLMETEVTKASDPLNTTWLDRFLKTDLKALTNAVKKENPTLTPSEINAELDKQYNDDAKKILDKWSAFTEILINYDNAIEKADEVIEEEVKKDFTLTENSSEQDLKKAAETMYTAEADMVKGGKAAEDIVVHDYLEATAYGDGTLLDFFQRDMQEFSGSDAIRELYPIVDALTAGQLAGLDFLSIKDMILMAVTDESGFNAVDLTDMQPASIYQDVNREIYERGGVALTNDALRAKASAQEKTETFQLSTLGYVLWGCTAAAGLAAAGSQIAKAVMKPAILKEADALSKEVAQRLRAYEQIKAEMLATNSQDSIDLTLRRTRSELYQVAKNDLNSLQRSDDFTEASKEFASKSKICNYLTAGFTVAMAILAAVSIYTTVTEMMEYYKVDFVPIPKYIVEESDITAVNDRGESIMVQEQSAYYKAVLCNRTDGSSDVEKKNHEILKDRSDLNGDVGRQWLALYSVKYRYGYPILADSLKLKTGSGAAPEGYSTGIHLFGSAAVQNLTDSKTLCYNDPNDGTYVYFKQDTTPINVKTATGSIVSSASIGAVSGLLVGVGITLIIVRIVNKKKKVKKA